MAHVDGFMGTVKTQSSLQWTRMVSLFLSSPITSSTSLSSTYPLTQIFEVDVVQSASSQQSKGKMKMKNKPQKNNNENENLKIETPSPSSEKEQQQKPKFVCLICGNDHYTRDCPHRDEVAKCFKGNSQPVVLKKYFPQ
jgi:hypothetical protein